MINISSNTKEYLHSIGAAIICIIVFLFLAYIIEPIVYKILVWFGRYFVPARYGGGTEIDNPGLLTITLRAIIFIYVSGLISYKAAVHVFPLQNKKKTIVSILILMFCSALGAYIFLKSIPNRPTLDDIFSEPINKGSSP